MYEYKMTRPTYNPTPNVTVEVSQLDDVLRVTLNMTEGPIDMKMVLDKVIDFICHFQVADLWRQEFEVIQDMLALKVTTDKDDVLFKIKILYYLEGTGEWRPETPR